MKGEQGQKSDPFLPLLICVMLLLGAWFLLLLTKVCVEVSLESALLLIYPLVTYFLVLKFSLNKHTKCKHANCLRTQDQKEVKEEAMKGRDCAPYEVLQIIKKCVFHSGEYVWF
jgi:hypothetical protein